MKVQVQYVTHSCRQRKFTAKAPGQQDRERWELSLTALDGESRQALTLTKLYDKPSDVPDLNKCSLGDSVTLGLSVRRGEWGDSLELMTVTPEPVGKGK